MLAYADQCVVLDEPAAAVIARADRVIVYCSRYGSMDVRDWPQSEAREFAGALKVLLDSESSPKPED